MQDAQRRFGEQLVTVFGEAAVRAGAPLAGLTTFKVGGPADWLVEVTKTEDVIAAVVLARHAHVPVTVLGGGSNVLIADAGIRGLVLRVRTLQLEQAGTHLVRADAGVTINGLVRWTINRGLAGLETWAGTPGTVGGALHGNAHFQGRLIGDVVREVRLVTRDGDVGDVPAGAMAFGYDTSRLQRSGEIALTATFRVEPDRDVPTLRQGARESLAFRKRTQPLDTPSAGCIFQNPDPRSDQVPAGIPPSAGALVDRAGLKDRVLGGARVSPVHGNFIVNDGRATAADIQRLIALCRHTVAERFGVHLREEIVYLGDFDA